MRVITGSARGVKLETLAGEHIRPTLDRVKENIFNMISGDINESTVADIFCGSGALGIEALSRGAAECVFVDDYKASCEIAKRNIAKTHFEDISEIVLSDFKNYLRKTDKKFDIIFVDPPYNKGLVIDTAGEVEKSGCLKDDGIMVLQFEADLSLDSISGFETIKDKKYGKTKVLIIRQNRIE